MPTSTVSNPCSTKCQQNLASGSDCARGRVGANEAYCARFRRCTLAACGRHRRPNGPNWGNFVAHRRPTSRFVGEWHGPSAAVPVRPRSGVRRSWAPEAMRTGARTLPRLPAVSPGAAMHGAARGRVALVPECWCRIFGSSTDASKGCSARSRWPSLWLRWAKNLGRPEGAIAVDITNSLPYDT